MKDYYGILGVAKTATQDEIKKAYRKLAMRWHPDHNKSAEAKDKFAEINEAYEVLGNEDKRREYDNPSPFANMGGFGGGGRSWSDGNGTHFEWSSNGPGGMNMEDILRSFMGGGGGFRRPDPNAPRDGDDMLLVLNVGFMEAINGCKKTIRLNIEDNGADNTRIQKTVTIEVKVPAGAPEGIRLRLAEQGNKGWNGGRNGDIYLQIHIGPHETFVRDGYDIIEKIQVPFETFVLGGTVKVKTLDGKDMDMTIDPYTNPGTVKSLSGKGSPIMNRLNSYGDLKVYMQLEMPNDLTDEEKQILGKYKEERAKRNK